MIDRPSKTSALLMDPLFLRFLAVGVLNTAFGYSIYSAGILLGLSDAAALLVATVLGVVFNFKTTGVLVFGSRDNRLIVRFVLAYAGTYCFNLMLLRLVRSIGIGPLVGQAICLPIVVVVTFAAMKMLVFRSVPSHVREP